MATYHLHEIIKFELSQPKKLRGSYQTTVKLFSRLKGNIKFTKAPCLLSKLSKTNIHNNGCVSDFTYSYC